MKRWLIVPAVSLGLLAPAAAFWQSRDSNYNVAISGSVTPATQTFEAFATENTGLAIGTYTSVNFGTAAPNRVIAIIAICRVTAGVANTISSVTIGGISATQASGAAASQNNSGSSDIWYASVPLNTSGTIVVTWANANTRSGVYVYSILTSTPTPAQGANAGNTNVTSLTQSIIVPANGVGITGIYTQQTGNTQSFTNATLDSSNAMTGVNGTASGHTTTTGSVSVTGSSTPTGNTMTMSLASWGP